MVSVTRCQKTRRASLCPRDLSKPPLIRRDNLHADSAEQVKAVAVYRIRRDGQLKQLVPSRWSIPSKPSVPPVRMPFPKYGRVVATVGANWKMERIHRDITPIRKRRAETSLDVL